MSQCIPFPNDYRTTLGSEAKNMTIRVDAEIGQYDPGEVYEACSYDGDRWGTFLQISEVTPMSVKDLSALGVPEEEVLRVCMDTKTDQVEVVRFTILRTPGAPRSNVP